MIEVSLQKRIFKAIKKLQKEIEELSKYGTPHLVGELKRKDDEWNVDLTISLIEEPLKEPLLVKEDSAIMFICPIKDTRPYKIYMNLISLLSKKPNKELKPGIIINGDLKRNFKRMGFEILWIHSQNTAEGSYLTVWTSKDGIKYTVTLQVIGPEKTMVVEVKKI